jgi:predicted nucleotidyltransferase
MSQPINAVVPTLDGPVLAVLARTSQPLTGRKIHQLASGGSETGTRKVLRRLAGTGLVIATEVGASVQYVLNREHLAANAVLELAALRSRLFERMRAAIEHWEPTVQPTHASVFGSTARGDGDLNSDVDLLLVHGFHDDPPTEWVGYVAALGDLVQGWTGNQLQTYELNEAELAQHIRSGDPLVKEWSRDGVTITGPDLRTLRKKIAHDVMPR